MGVSFQANRKHKKAGHSKASVSGNKFKDAVEKKSVKFKTHTKADNVNTKNQLRQNAAQASQNKSGSALKPPKNITLISLSSTIDAASVKDYILNSDDIAERSSFGPISTVCTCPKFNSRLNLVSPVKNIYSMYEALKSSDSVAFLIDAVEGADDEATQLIDALRAHGYTSSVFGLVCNLDSVPKKEQKARCNDFDKFFNYQFVKATTFDIRSLPLVIRSFCLSSSAPIPWTSQYPHFQVHNATNCEEGTLVYGWLRAQQLDVNRIVHINNVGEFQPLAFFEEIDPISLNKRNAERNLIATPENPDSFSTATQPKINTQESENAQTNVDEVKHKRARRAVRFDAGDDDSDEGDEEMEFSDLEDQLNNNEFTMDLIQEKAVYEVSQRQEGEFDLPDEVDLDNEIPVREKYNDYRSLQSFRKSEWSPYENLPEQYSQIVEFDDFNSFVNWSRRTSLENAKGRIGSYVAILIPGQVSELIHEQMQSQVLNVVSLFNSERKTSVSHNRINTEIDVSEDDEFIVISGWRTLIVKPIFSLIINGTDRTRYLRKVPAESKSICCSFTAPINIGGGIPVIGLTMDSTKIAFTGSFLESNPKKLIIRRIQLTGYPTKVGSRMTRITMMFNNPEDVEYFIPVELSTRQNLRGRIIGPVGTHGEFKARFNRKINHSDMCILPLYKRIFPKLDTLKVYGSRTEGELIE